MDDVGDSIKEGNANWIFSGEVSKTLTNMSLNLFHFIMKVMI